MTSVPPSLMRAVARVLRPAVAGRVLVVAVTACAADWRDDAAPASSPDRHVERAGAESSAPPAGRSDDRAGAASSRQRVPTFGIPDSLRRRVLDSLLGPAPLVPPAMTAMRSMVFARYERDFVRYDEKQWAECGPKWDCLNYYDRASIYYAWWRRTQLTKYLDRANQLAVDYRKNYLEAANYGVAFHWSMMDGVAMHYLATGDTMSLIAVGKVADNFAWHTKNLGKKADMDNRFQGYWIRALLLGWLLDAPSTGLGGTIGIPGGNDFAAVLRRGLTSILSTQDADGGWRYAYCQATATRPQFHTTHPFTVGLLLDALTRYYDLFEPDPRIPPAVKRAVDYLWAHDWVPAQRAFKYVGDVCPGEGNPNPAADLNNLLVNAYGWTYRVTGDPAYRQRATEIMTGAVNSGAAELPKQFNQIYTSSYRFFSYIDPLPRRP